MMPRPAERGPLGQAARMAACAARALWVRLCCLVGHAAYLATRQVLGNQRYLFLWSHTRSGSSALSVVLASHPAISDIEQAHVRHSSRAGLGLPWLAVARRRFRDACRANSLHDKILHDHLTPDLDIVASLPAHHLFLLREPMESLTSSLRLLERSALNVSPEVAAGIRTAYRQVLAELRA